MTCIISGWNADADADAEGRGADHYDMQSGEVEQKIG